MAYHNLMAHYDIVYDSGLPYFEWICLFILKFINCIFVA